MDRRVCALVAAAVAAAASRARADLTDPSPRAAAIARCHRELAGAVDALAAILGPSANEARALSVVDLADGAEVRLATGALGPASPTGAHTVVASCSAGTMRLPQGRLTLPPGWIAVDRLALDGARNRRGGTILDARDTERLRYDIGARTSLWASAADGALSEWDRPERLGAVTLHARLHQGRLTMTLLPATNFSGPAATRAEADALLAIVRTLRP